MATVVKQTINGHEYLYRVEYLGNGNQKWDFLGKPGVVDVETGPIPDSTTKDDILTNDNEEEVEMRVESTALEDEFTIENQTVKYDNELMGTVDAYLRFLAAPRGVDELEDIDRDWLTSELGSKGAFASLTFTSSGSEGMFSVSDAELLVSVLDRGLNNDEQPDLVDDEMLDKVREARDGIRSELIEYIDNPFVRSEADTPAVTNSGSGTVPGTDSAVNNAGVEHRAVVRDGEVTNVIDTVGGEDTDASSDEIVEMVPSPYDSVFGTEKVRVETPYEAKDVMNDLDWDETHADWSSEHGRWTVDKDAVDAVVEALGEAGFTVSLPANGY